MTSETPRKPESDAFETHWKSGMRERLLVGHDYAEDQVDALVDHLWDEAQRIAAEHRERMSTTPGTTGGDDRG